MISFYNQITLKQLAEILKPMGINIDDQVKLRELLIEFCKKWYPTAIRADFTVSSYYNDENYAEKIEKCIALDKQNKELEIKDEDQDKYHDALYELMYNTSGEDDYYTISIDLTKDTLDLYQRPLSFLGEISNLPIRADEYPPNNLNPIHIHYTD